LGLSFFDLDGPAPVCPPAENRRILCEVNSRCPPVEPWDPRKKLCPECPKLSCPELRCPSTPCPECPEIRCSPTPCPECPEIRCSAPQCPVTSCPECPELRCQPTSEMNSPSPSPEEIQPSPTLEFSTESPIDSSAEKVESSTDVSVGHSGVITATVISALPTSESSGRDLEPELLMTATKIWSPFLNQFEKDNEVMDFSLKGYNCREVISFMVCSSNRDEMCLLLSLVKEGRSEMVRVFPMEKKVLREFISRAGNLTECFRKTWYIEYV
jgi:hypothetical protein